jgi:hypothetical protein
MGLLDNVTQQAYYSNQYLKHGDYQFIDLHDIIDNFMATYVGPDKILSKTNRSDVVFHAHRAMQELSFDTFKSCKAQEITVPPSLQMTLPQDYVNYTKISWVDSAGIKHLLYPTSKTSNPSNPIQNSDGDFALEAIGTLTSGTTSVVLDDEYSNILVGMIVSAPNIPTGTTVVDVVTTANITTITLSVATTGTYTETLTFTPVDGSLVLQEESSIILLNTKWAIADNKITLASTADADSIEVGMLVSDEYFDEGTTVVDINGIIVTVSTNSTNPGTATSLTFISPNSTSDTWSNYKSGTPSENQDDYIDDTYWPMDGSRFGLDPQHAQANGSFYIDCHSGKIHFSSNISGKTVVLDYISDSLGDDDEMQVHKFAEEAMYKHIAYAIMSTRANVPEYQVARFKKERFAETRKAKLRLSNIKLEEITQILRGKSKQIKH